MFLATLIPISRTLLDLRIKRDMLRNERLFSLKNVCVFLFFREFYDFIHHTKVGRHRKKSKFQKISNILKKYTLRYI